MFPVQRGVDEFKRLGKFTPMVSAVIFGGVGQPGQVRELSRHPDVVVACPGRLLDLIEQGLISLNAVETLVLDEADHMFDMGFLPRSGPIEGAPVGRRSGPPWGCAHEGQFCVATGLDGLWRLG